MKPKRMQNSKMFQVLSEKAEMLQTFCFYNIERGSGHTKPHAKTTQNKSNIYAQKKHAKTWKAISKRTQNLHQNPHKIVKVLTKQNPKIDMEKRRPRGDRVPHGGPHFGGGFPPFVPKSWLRDIS